MTSSGGAGVFDFSAASGAGGEPLVNSKRSVFPSASGLPNFFDVTLATSFKLSDCTNWPAFTSMYDAYKINSVTCNIEYLNNVSAVNSTGLMPSLYLYWDQDDAVVPTNVVLLQQKQGVKRRQFGNRGVTSIRTSGRPKLSVGAIDSGGVLDASIVMKSQFLDCVNSNIQHYALKMAITDLYLPGSSAVTQAIRFNWKYNVSFRAPLLTA